MISRDRIYFSTGAFRNLKPVKAIKLLLANDIKNIELSSGKFDLSTRKRIEKLSKKENIIIHNFFPVPKKNFVLNLASNNPDIFKKSLNMIKKNIILSSLNKLKIYSFHAGFLIDPKIHELGKQISTQKLQDRKKTIKLFVKRLKDLSKFAKKYNVEILIENNVITKKNLIKFKSNPLLMTTTSEILEIMKKTPNNINLLLDVGHLKVSAITLKFDYIKAIKKLDKYIKGYHLSDNNGHEDSNKEINSNSWFLKYLKKDKKYLTIEVYDNNLNKIKKMINLLNKKIIQN